MKRAKWLLALLALIVFTVPALADSFFVLFDEGMAVRVWDEYTNEVLGYIPSGAALEPDPQKSTELAAYVTYEGVSGFVLWRYLTRTASGEPAPAVETEAPAPEPTPEPTPEPDPEPQEQEVDLDDGLYDITVTGGTIQRANAKNNKAEGEKLTEISVTPEDNIIIAAKIPKNKKIDYWVINGIRYDFDHVPKNIRLTNADQDWNFEIVYTKSKAQTLLTEEQIQEARTGEALWVKTIDAELCHIKSGTKGAGGWITEFEFTEDYKNRATNKQEKGGQVTAKVRAVSHKGKKVTGWKFNGTELYPSVEITWLLPHMLNTSMTYEPLHGKAASTTEAPPPVTPAPVPAPTYYTVTCKYCVFTGGGYSGASSGSVPAGTKITVRNTTDSSVARWEVNGAYRLDGNGWMIEAASISLTINRDTGIVAHGIVN